VQRAYDTLSRLTSETQGPNPLGGSGKTVSYEYNADGSRATLTYPSSYELTYTVDAVGRWTKIENASSDDRGYAGTLVLKDSNGVEVDERR
jgi:hypothetical protein